jgi:hypothetical protein
MVVTVERLDLDPSRQRLPGGSAQDLVGDGCDSRRGNTRIEAGESASGSYDGAHN